MGKRVHDEGRSAAERRREKFQEAAAPRRGATPTVIVAMVAVLLLITLVYVVSSRNGAAATGAAAGQDLSFAASDFADGVARFYTYTTAAGRQVRFFVMKSADGVIRAAFDACDTCYRERKGYRQQGTEMVCNNCGQSFRSTDINVLQGGCNPAPLERAVVDGRIVLRADALSAGAWYF